ncbi:UDP-glucose 4-epimerase GalE [Microbulbifer sp. JMSA004]|uniref:UDP-glucose 4-epimerase GalE n=1 Tax=unclassified Microbulbifer TaxID=2619833 RepID=UPI0024ACD1A3|nr:UDP-glucose 4-epimerase GalE [Microbulbifer sp. VAAF005]WHI48928.1 UDP-glucose 4-epimerase GalE [Microbulbifer sp. VAAF005]
MAILVTGGAGYIGSHTCIELLAAGIEPVVVDNLSNSSEEALRRVELIGGKAIPFHHLDINDKEGLRKVFSDHEIDAVIHFAGLKAVGESVAQPLRYYQNNVAGTLTLCEVMEEYGVHRLIFSSSATVYGDPEAVPIKEDFPTGATNPYGSSKLIVENMLRDLCAAPNSQWKVSLLRYFNPIGAHESGTIGEDPSGIPNNLLPYVSQVAVGRLEQLQVFGGDYDTVDGTGVRDYIHVVDLARGHLAALNLLCKEEVSEGCYTHNLGTGQGSSVLQVVRAFESVSGKEIPYNIAPRRAGDIAECYADPELAEKELGWKAEYDLVRMVEDTWRWQHKNPKGYSAE